MGSHWAITKRMSCSTRRTAHSNSPRSAATQDASRATSPSSRPEVGSSNKRMRGTSTMARPNSTILAEPIANEPAEAFRRAVRPHSSSTWSTRARRSRSRRRREGKAKRSAAMPPPPPCHSVAARRLSSTLSQPKVCTRWNVRRTPCRARLAGEALDTSIPSMRTVPRWGVRIPEIARRRALSRPRRHRVDFTLWTSPGETQGQPLSSPTMPPKRTKMSASSRAHGADALTWSDRSAFMATLAVRSPLRCSRHTR